VRNAQEATPVGGSVRISAERLEDKVKITIADTGCGMTQQFIRDRLFRPFDSTKGSQSMGIGAYQARDYADSLGGRLEVTSRVGEGTVFGLWLPRDAATPSA
jgi:signal transduction histidine kinase